MPTHTITEKDINRFEAHLSEGEYAPGTIEKYLRDVRRFYLWINDRQLTKAEVNTWKSHLIAGGYVPSTINAMLVAVNQFLKFMGCGECCVKELRIQKRLFRSTEKELTKTEYERLISAAEKQEDYLQSPPARSCKIIGTKGKIEFDLLRSTIAQYDSDGNEILNKIYKFERNDMFIKEMRTFLEALLTREQTCISLSEGIKSLRIAQAVKQSLATGTVIKL